MEKLKALQAGNRAAITRSIRKLQEITATSDDYEEEKANGIFTTLLKRKETVDELNTKILEVIDTEGAENEILDQDEYESNLNVDIKGIEKLLKAKSNSYSEKCSNIHETTSSLNVHASEFHMPELNTSQQFSSYSSHKLPKLGLPNFSGDLLQWQSFWDAFDTAVNNNITLNSVQKFTYLKSLLHGEALETVSGFALTNANYKEAVILLKNRYGQEHKVIQRYMEALLEIPPADNSLKSLRKFHDKLEIYIRGLDSLGQSEDTYGALLVPIILNKLDPQIRRNIARENNCAKWSLSELRRCILNEINVMEAGFDVNFHNYSTLHDTNIETTAAFFTNAKNNISTKFCVFCNEKTHYASQCKTVVDYEARIKIVKSKQLCFNCLGKHKLAECKSKKSCKLCEKRHHTSICKSTSRTLVETRKPSDDIPASQGNKSATSQSDNNATRNNDRSTPTPISSLHSSASNPHKSVLLKTAIAPVHVESTSVNSNILLDEGAMRSFITESLAEKLQLKTHKTETVHLCGFGGKEKEVKNIPTGTINLETVDGDFIKMDVLIVPEISVPIPIQRDIAVGMPHLSGLRLAHPIDGHETFEISLLIGVDYYWEIVMDKIIRGDGPTAVASRIGYLLSGPLKKQNSNTSNISMMNIIFAHKAEEANLDRFWEIESAGIKENSNKDFEK